MYRINKIPKSKIIFLDNKDGFTIIEMLVVLSIIAMLFTLMAFGMMPAGKQVRLQNAAKTLQANIRKAANNSIAVSPDMNDPTKPAKAWVLEINNGASDYRLLDYYGDTNPPNQTSPLPDPINLEGGITVSVQKTNGSPIGTPVYFVFSSPFARFTAAKNNINNWEDNDDTGEIWPQPPGLVLDEDIMIVVKDPENREIKLIVNYKTGETSIGE